MEPSTIRELLGTALAGLLLLAWPGQPARAAESYDNCSGFVDSVPAVISTQGTWCLRKDLATAMSEGAAIEIAANNVTLDCNDFKIGGLAAGVETLATGVRAVSQFNTTVRNCRIRGFVRGVSLSGGGHKVEDNTLESSRATAMYVSGAGSVVRGNRVFDSGGSPRSALAVVSGIWVSDGVDVIGNRVGRVHAFPDFSFQGAAGIHAVNNGGGSIIGNRVSDVVPAGSQQGFGIRNLGTVSTPTRIIVSRNILKGGRSTAFNDVAIACIDTGTDVDAISTDNVFIGFDAAVSGCSPGDNSVNRN